MENQNMQYQEEQQIQREYKMQLWKDRVYRFFYNIWPGVSGFFAFVFYHLFRIIRGFFRTALEELRHGG